MLKSNKKFIIPGKLLQIVPVNSIYFNLFNTEKEK